MEKFGEPMKAPGQLNFDWPVLLLGNNATLKFDSEGHYKVKGQTEINRRISIEVWDYEKYDRSHTPRSATLLPPSKLYITGSYVNNKSLDVRYTPNGEMPEIPYLEPGHRFYDF